VQSSASIKALIINKEAEIQACNTKIDKLVDLIADQKSARETFKQKADDFSGAMTQKKNKVEKVAHHASSSTLANKYASQMDEKFSAATRNQIKTKLSDISTYMKDERASNKTTLTEERARLVILNDELDVLEDQYDEALVSEGQSSQPTPSNGSG
jgi:transketolase